MEELLKQFLGEFREFKTEFQGFKNETNERFDRLEGKVDKLEVRFDKIEEKVDIIQEQLSDFEAKTANNHIETISAINSLKDDLVTIEAVTGKNMSDIAHLKLVK